MRSLRAVSELFPQAVATGLTDAEVAESRSRFGANRLTPLPREPVWKKFLDKFDEPIIKILLAASLLKIVVDLFEASPLAGGLALGAVLAVLVVAFAAKLGEWLPSALFVLAAVLVGVSIALGKPSYEGLAVMIAVVLATGVAFLSEYRSDKEFEKLNAAKDSVLVKVQRDGGVHTIALEDVVVGELVLLEMGDEIPADGRVVKANELLVDQSLMTGESEPVKKTTAGPDETADSPDQHGCVFRGTQVVDGVGQMTVTNVGDDTMIGQIARRLGDGEEAQGAYAPRSADDRIQQKLTISKASTPLQEKLEVLARLISKVGYVAAVAIFLALLVQGLWTGEVRLAGPEEDSRKVLLGSVKALLSYFVYMVIIIVVAVPEGLPMSVTVAPGARQRGLRTGRRPRQDRHDRERRGAARYAPLVAHRQRRGELDRELGREERQDGDGGQQHRGRAAQLASHRRVVPPRGVELHRTPHTVPRALPSSLLLRPQAHDHRCEVRRARGHTGEGRTGSDPRGVPRVPRSRRQCPGTHAGGADPDSDADHRRRGGCDADAGVREDAIHHRRAEIERGLVFTGWVGIRDPLRDDVKEAVRQCRAAGIEVKMITGDTIETARAIGREIGLLDAPDSLAMTHAEFEKLTDEELSERLHRLRVLARALPADKYRIVRLLQAQNHVVAMTGDGTNDAPALKKADVGLAMGISGTEVAKEASKIVLLDDAFSTIVRGVHWGRALYENIQRFIQFQLTINVSALLIAFLGPFLGVKPPFTVLQLLWINVIMDTFAAIALCSEPPRANLMHRPPKRRDESILTPAMLGNIGITAAFFVVVMITLLLGMQHHGWFGGGNMSADFPQLTMRQVTSFFTVYVFFQVWNQINCRSLSPRESGLHRLFENPQFLVIASLTVVGQVLIVTLGGRVFNVEPLGVVDWLVIAGATSSVLVFAEVARRIRKQIEV